VLAQSPAAARRDRGEAIPAGRWWPGAGQAEEGVSLDTLAGLSQAEEKPATRKRKGKEA